MRTILWICVFVVAVMSGILSIFREVVGIFWPNTVPATDLFWVCTRTAFGSALISLWFKERKATDAAQKEIETLTQRINDQYSTNLIGSIVQINHHKPPARLGEYSCSVVIVAEIKNLGIDTSVDRYGLSYKDDAGREVAGVLHGFSPSIKLEGSYGSIEYFATDALYSKTIAPIARGGKAVGVLWFLFKAVQVESFQPERLTLYFRDIKGTRWSAKCAPLAEELHDQPALYPGIKLGIQRPQA